MNLTEGIKIGYDAKKLFHNFTGLGVYSRALLNHLYLKNKDIEYHLYSPSPLAEPCKNHFSFFREKENISLHFFSGMFPAYRRTFGMIPSLQKNGIELYHGLSNELPVGIAKSKIKSVVTIHDLIFRNYSQSASYLQKKIYDWKAQYACKAADRIITVSQSSKKDIMQAYKIPSEKIKVVYPCCLDIYYEEANDTKADFQKLQELYALPETYFLFVGSLIKRKNIALIIKAYQQLAEADKIPVLIVGQGNKRHKKELMQLVTHTKGEKYFIWLEHIHDNRQLKTIFQNAMAFIFPSFYEGFGMPVAEAFMCKTPVITSNITSLPEAGGPDSLYIHPGNPSELAEALQKVLHDSPMRTLMAEKGHQYALHNFAPEKMAQQVFDIYMEVLERKL